MEVKELNIIKKTIPNINTTCDNKFAFSSLGIGHTRYISSKYNYCRRGTLHYSYYCMHDLDWYCEYELPLSIKGGVKELSYKMRKKESIHDIAR